MTITRPFYSGETIDLVVPRLEHIDTSTWADWFNSQVTNRYTNHAVFPNTLEGQRAYFLGLRDAGRLALLITRKDSEEPIGTVSLSGIDFRLRTAAVAIVMDSEAKIARSPFASLEAMATLTQHAFDVMGLERVSAGQVYPALARWNQLLETIGYRSEGIKRDAFRRGHFVSDEVTLACLYGRFRRLADSRGGRLWPGTDQMRGLVRKLPQKPFAELLDESQRTLEKEYFGD